MSQPSPFGQFPGAPPKPAAAPAMPLAGESAQMEYMRSFHFIFENPNWGTSVLWGFVAFLLGGMVPGGTIISQLLFTGYQFDIVQSLIQSPGRPYPVFDLNRFGDYLARGLWPFLVNLVVSLVLFPIMVILAIPFVLLGFAAANAGEDAAVVLVTLVILVGLVVAFVVGLLLMLIVTPMIIRAGVAQDFMEGFNISWARDFAAKTWKEMILTALFTMVAGMVLGFVGLAACVIGLYAAIPILMMMQAHLFLQLYRVYLSRGGTPIPLKPQAFTA